MALQQLVVERLAEAMPGVDFRSLVAARTEAMAQAQEHDVPLQALITNQVSQFDRTFVSTYNKLVAGDEIKPALKLVNPDGESATYIFCKQSDLRMTAEGALGGEYSIQLGRLDDTTFDTMLQDTALKYLMDLAQEKGIKLKYEIRKANEGTYIIGSVPDEVLTDTEPLVRYIDITREETGAGG